MVEASSQIEKLEKMIEIEDDPEVKSALQAQIATLKGEGGADDDWIISDMDQEQYDEAAERPDFVSTFPTPGDWPCLFGEIENYNKDGRESFLFHYSCPAPGYEGEVPFVVEDGWMFAGKDAWRGQDGKSDPTSKLKAIITALDLEYKLIGGKIALRKSAAMGKIGKVVFRVKKGAMYTDPQTGKTKPSTIAQAVTVIKMDAEAQDLGV